MAGAIVVEDGEGWFLVGRPKRPCGWEERGLGAPPEGGDVVVRLAARGTPAPLEPPVLVVDGEAESVARRLADRMLIHRNGSVSERLWNLVAGVDPDTGAAGAAEVRARWLLEAPDAVWAAVRDTVLRCV